jgi:hypothetical protein
VAAAGASAEANQPVGERDRGSEPAPDRENPYSVMRHSDYRSCFTKTIPKP